MNFLDKKYEKRCVDIVIFCMCLAFTLISIISFDNDMLWHLKLGEEILNTGLPTDIDTFSWQEGLKWTSQEWLYDLLIYIIVKYADLIGFIVFGFFMYFTSYILYKKENLNYKSSILFMAMFFYRLFFAQNRCNRPSIFSYLFFIVMIIGIISMNENLKDFKTYLKFFLIGLAMANFHGGNLTSCILTFLIAIFLDLVLFMLNRVSNKSLLKDEIIFVSFILGSLINPYGYKIYKIGITVMGLDSSSKVSEWGSLVFNDLNDYLLVFMMLLSIIAVVDSKDFKVLNRRAFLCLGLTCAYTIGGLINSRAAMVTSIFICYTNYRYLEEFILKYINLIKNSRGQNQLFDKISNMVSPFKNLYILLICALFIIPFCQKTEILVNNSIFTLDNLINKTSKYSIEIIDYIVNDLDEGTHILNSYNAGNYILYKGGKDFVDSRQQPFCNEVSKGNTSLDEYFALNETHSYYKHLMELVDKYDIEYIFWDNQIISYEEGQINDFKDDWEIILEDEGDKNNQPYSHQYLLKKKETN